MRFDPSRARERVEKFWSLNAEFGLEHNAYRVYLNEIVSDRYVLVNGLQLLRGELQLAGERGLGDDVIACGGDLSVRVEGDEGVPRVVGEDGVEGGRAAWPSGAGRAAQVDSGWVGRWN